jgi:4-diphosphocytidyl-2-C-methyl-D-erythritol kinase
LFSFQLAFMLTEIARAKINLALHVTGRRMDGLHELDSVVAFAEFGDVLTLQEAAADSLLVGGPFASGLSSGDDNLVMQALVRTRALYASTGVSLPHFAISLEKNLPIASGIGGGSADAAAIIRLLMKFASVDVPRADLHGLMVDLGADVPVCFQQRQCRMQGIGDVIKPLAQPIQGHILLVNPLKPCSTAAVFKTLALEPGQNHKFGINLEAPSRWRNDLTEPAVQVVPEIKRVLDEMTLFPEITSARMSGSGATCFAILKDAGIAKSLEERIASAQPTWWVKASKLV